jgi:hypothetical protein
MTEGDDVGPDTPVVIPTGGLPTMGKEDTAPAPATTELAPGVSIEPTAEGASGVTGIPAGSPALDVQQIPSTLTVRKQFLKLADGRMTVVREEEGTETIAVHRFVTSPATPGYSAQRTVNLGDFNSLKVGVWGSVPCYVEEYDDACQWIQEHTDARMDAISDEIDGAMDGGETGEAVYEAATVAAPAPAATPAPAAGGGLPVVGAGGAVPTGVSSMATFKGGGLPTMGK